MLYPVGQAEVSGATHSRAALMSALILSSEFYPWARVLDQQRVSESFFERRLQDGELLCTGPFHLL